MGQTTKSTKFFCVQCSFALFTQATGNVSVCTVCRNVTKKLDHLRFTVVDWDSSIYLPFLPKAARTAKFSQIRIILHKSCRSYSFSFFSIEKQLLQANWSPFINKGIKALLNTTVCRWSSLFTCQYNLLKIIFLYFY